MTTLQNEVNPAQNIVKMQTPFQRFVADYFESRIATVAFAVLLVILFIGVFASVISPTDPYDLAVVDVMDSRLPPGTEGSTGMTFYGLRTSLGVGVVSGLIALCIGGAVGLIAAYFGGKTETLIMRVVDLQLSFPAILVALVLVAVLGKGVDKIIVALVVVQWAYYARTVRGSALVERQKEYIEAATCLALSHRRIVFRHLLPNCLPPLIVVGTLQIAHAISLEATLSFLGIGLPITEPSLGLLIANGFEYMLSQKYWISFFPGIALLITIVTINLVGDQLRDVLNPRLQK